MSNSDTIDLLDYMRIIAKRSRLVLAITILSVIAAVAVTLRMTPIYEASAKLLVLQEPTSRAAQGQASPSTPNSPPEVSPSEDPYQVLITNEKLATTLSEIAKGRVVADRVVNDLDLKMDSTELQTHVGAAPIRDTQLIKITARHANPQQAKNIVQSMSKAFAEEAGGIEPFSAAAVPTKISIKTVEPPIVPAKPIQPRPALNIIAGLLVGLIVSIGLALFLEGARAREHADAAAENGSASRTASYRALSEANVEEPA